MKRKSWAALLPMLAFLGSMALVGTANADSIYQVGGSFTCPHNSCLGGAYTLQFIGNNSGSTFQVILTATTPGSGSNSASFGDYISSVEFGDGKGISSATLTGVKDVTTNTSLGTSLWNPTVYGNLSNSGCNPGPAPNACNNQTLKNGMYTQALANGNTYSWTWNVTFQNAGLDLNESDMHIGLQYENANDTSNGLIVSESGVSSAIPEPSSAVLLGTGLSGLALLRRLKKGTKPSV